MIINGDCLYKLKELKDNSVDCLITDPPYGIDYKGTSWDNYEKGQKDLQKAKDEGYKSGDAAINMKHNHPIYKFEGMKNFFTPRFKECLRVMKPGAFGFVCCIPRQDCLSRMMIALEDAGFKINFSSIYWKYNTGLPKGYNMNNGSFAGYQPKPALEVIIVVMKPLSESGYKKQFEKNGKGVTWLKDVRVNDRFPSNLFIDTPKANKKEKNAGVELNNHPTVKPMKLMSYLITLGSREGDVILDPFSGSGTTACSAIMLRRNFIAIEKEEEYIPIIENRVNHYKQIIKNEPLKV